MKPFKDYIEEVAANAVAGGGVDLTPSKDQVLFQKKDKRRKNDSDYMFRRAQGLSFINAMRERKNRK